jgi:transposase
MPKSQSYRVTLSVDEISLLKDIIHKGKHSAQKRKRAQALLLANDQMFDKDIAESLGMHRRGLEDLRRRFVEEGFEVTLDGKTRGHRQRSLTGEDEARLIALACEKKPDGVHHWSLRLLQERWATLENTDTKTVSHETIRKILKKANLRLGRSGSGASHRKPTRNS